MSLINEALKRAEEKKRLHGAASPSSADLPPIYRDRRFGRRPRALIILLGLMLLAGGLLAWAAMRNRRGGSARPAAAATTPVRRPTGKAAPHKQEPTVHISPETELVFAKTVEAIDYYTPPAAVRPAKPKPSTPTSQPAVGQASSQPASQPAEPVAAPSKPDHPVRPIMLTDPKDKDRPRSFTVSGIMYSAAGSSAIVNGRLVRPGDKIGDVKVIKINPHDVELELDGRRFRVPL